MARECIRGLLRRKGPGGIVTILGLTFKEDVPDTRNSRVIDIVRELEIASASQVQVHDPLANPEDGEQEYGLTLTELDALQSGGCGYSGGGARSAISRAAGR